MHLRQEGYVRNELDFPGPLAESDSGKGVGRVQEWLEYHGHGTPIDEIFGPATSRSLRGFAVKEGESFSGHLTQELWSRLIRPMSQVVELSGQAGQDSFVDRIRWLLPQHLGARPVELGGANAGPWVRLYMNGVDGVDQLWCAGFVTFVLRQATARDDRPHDIRGSTSCDDLAEQAVESGRFIGGLDLNAEKARAEMGRCGLFLVRKTDDDWVHTGFAYDFDDRAFTTVEGNADPAGSSNGYKVACRNRSIEKCDFIRLS